MDSQIGLSFLFPTVMAIFTKDTPKILSNTKILGAVNTRAHIKWVDSKYDLKGAKKILLTGMSAGGIATNTWSNYLKDYVGDPNKIYSVSDSGMFDNFPSITG